ncbi:MAG: hypothetical protein V4671_00615 [Armatimonadota bacterium]
MTQPNENTLDGGWTTTDLEAAARDLLDVGVWETAEEEERASLPPTAAAATVTARPQSAAHSAAPLHNETIK